MSTLAIPTPENQSHHPPAPRRSQRTRERTLPVGSTSGGEPDREQSVRVMVVDDQASIRRAAHALVKATGGFESAGSAEHFEGLDPAIASSGAVAIMGKEDLRPSMLRELWTMHGRRRPGEG